MNKRKLNDDIQIKVRKYYEYLNSEENQDFDLGDEYIEGLPLDLKKEVMIDIYGKILNSKKIFHLNFSHSFINAIAAKIKEQKFGIDEIIYNKGDESNKIFFIL